MDNGIMADCTLYSVACGLQRFPVLLRTSRSGCAKLDRPLFELAPSLAASYPVYELYIDYHGCVLVSPSKAID